MRPAEFVDVAGELLGATFSTAEARHRSAVGRAYYGVYHDACALARDLGETFNPKDHDGPVGAFHRLATSTGDDGFRLLAVALKGLQANRKKADYQFHPSVSHEFSTPNFSVRQVTDGHGLLQKIKALRAKHLT